MGPLYPLLSAASCLLLLFIHSSCTPTAERSTGTVHVDYADSTGYHLVRNGQPFVVKGGAGANHLPLLKELGGNTVRVYDPAKLEATLEQAETLGLAVVADIPLPAYYRGEDYVGLSQPGLTDSVLAVVDRFRDHPALLFWMLGNEVFTEGYDRAYMKRYNALARAVREHDPNHPISTGVIPHQLLKLKISLTGPDVDFLSLNIFGNLSNFDQLKKYLTPIWRGPYLISEWSFNGPWEAENTLWGAPIESPSPTKATHLAERYRRDLADPESDRMLGDLVFYWGQKYERTPTWFSLLSPEGAVSEMAFALGNIWQGRQLPFPGPRVEYLLLNEMGARDNIFLTPGAEATATVRYLTEPVGNLTVRWEIRAEDWLGRGEVGAGPEALPGLFKSTSLTEATFQAPLAPGPYRILYQVMDTAGYFATANIPFYVLSPAHAK
ncbi:glycoside hydrolase family 2 TIM barrel-domain containing protein [Neolewinella litorea]|uniref:Glycoside hydrolase family 2 catalytic domain-containing protein n=1 Tax=Neolewinella litorea TaxID=2562452 RepID=A0A4S4NRB4_9BACT|nr:glycoside hydrolase family 2 TIM barrel-domain containing protein [Neolewinella litorea]THH41727.1 hypothetical protein E4021_03785 [Neolewinella litorea]